MGNVYNPDTKHFLDKDIYTFISFSQESKGPADSTGYSRSFIQQMNLHDTVTFAHSYIILDSIHAAMMDTTAQNAELAAFFRILSMKAGILNATIRYKVVNSELKREDATVDPLEIRLRFEGVSPDTKAIKVGLYEKKQDYIVIKAMIFPFMNVMWIGAIIMFSGLCYSIIRRVRNRQSKVVSIHNHVRLNNQQPEE